MQQIPICMANLLAMTALQIARSTLRPSVRAIEAVSLLKFDIADGSPSD
jgi:hypothetical protein